MVLNGWYKTRKYILTLIMIPFIFSCNNSHNKSVTAPEYANYPINVYVYDITANNSRKIADQFIGRYFSEMNVVASTSSANMLKLLDISTGVITSITVPGILYIECFSANVKKALITKAYGDIYWVDLESGVQIFVANGEYPRLSPDNKLVVYCKKKPDEKYSIYVFNIETNETMLIKEVRHPNYISLPDFTLDSSYILYFETPNIYNNNGTKIHKVKITEPASDSVIYDQGYIPGGYIKLPNSTKILFYEALSADVYDPFIIALNYNSLISEVLIHGSSPVSSANGKDIIFYRGTNNPLRIYNLESRIENSYNITNNIICSYGLSADGKKIVFSSYDKPVQ